MAVGTPSRTLGFLFADLRNYTRFVEAHGDTAASDLLQRYRALVRDTLQRFDGAEIRTEGDSFYIVLPSAGVAVQCGLAILQAATDPAHQSDGPAIQIGIGVHAGETADTGEGPVGSAVNIAARVCARAKPGELLVTDTVRSLTRTFLRVRFESRGSPRLKGIQEPIALFAVLPTGVSSSAGGGGLAVRWQGRLPIGATRAVAVAAVLVALAVAATAAFGVLGRSSASPAPSLATGSGVPSPPVADVYPNAAERDLLDRLPSTILMGKCRRAGPTEAAPHALASIHCDLDITSSDAETVTYDQFSATKDMDGYVTGLQAQFGLTKGDCRKQISAWQVWVFDQFEGKLLCYADASRRASLAWSYDASRIVARASRSDQNSAKLYSWWLVTRGLLVD